MDGKGDSFRSNAWVADCGPHRVFSHLSCDTSSKPRRHHHRVDIPAVRPWCNRCRAAVFQVRLSNVQTGYRFHPNKSACVSHRFLCDFTRLVSIIVAVFRYVAATWCGFRWICMFYIKFLVSRLIRISRACKEDQNVRPHFGHKLCICLEIA